MGFHPGETRQQIVPVLNLRAAKKMPRGDRRPQCAAARQFLEPIRLFHVEKTFGCEFEIGMHQIKVIEIRKQFFPVHERDDIVVGIKELVKLAKPAREAAKESESGQSGMRRFGSST